MADSHAAAQRRQLLPFAASVALLALLGLSFDFRLGWLTAGLLGGV